MAHPESKSTFVTVARRGGPLLAVLLWLAFVGGSVWQHARESNQPPIFDAATYFQKAHNVWAGMSGTTTNPFDVEPTVRPPGTVLMSYPFGFNTDFRGFYFRSVFLPIALLCVSIVIAGYRRDLGGRSAWHLALLTIFATTLPAFYYFEVSPEFPAPSHWGLVDNFMGGVAALAAAATVRSVRDRSWKWTVVAAFASSFCFLIKPAGVLVMALIALAWFVLALLRLQSEKLFQGERALTIRWLVRGLAIFGALDLLVVAAAFASRYLSRGNLAFGAAAINVMKSDQPLTWEAFRDMIHVGLGYAFVAWGLVSALMVVRLLLRKEGNPGPSDRPMSVGLILVSSLILVVGIWFWLFAVGGVYQIRYFVPFVLMAVVFAVPVVVRAASGAPRWQVIGVSLLLLLPAANIGALLAQRNPSPDWQRWAGVNLTSGGANEVAGQARDFVAKVRSEGRDVTLYAMPLTAADAEFQAAIDYARIAAAPRPAISMRRPVDWQRPSAFRVNEMLDADFWLFEPVRDPAQVRSVLANTHKIEAFAQERELFQAWASTLAKQDGVEVLSDTPKVRIVRIEDTQRLATSLDALVAAHTWGSTFMAANPRRRLSEQDVAEALARYRPVLESVRFSDGIELRALSVARDGNEIAVRIWWRPLPGLKERDWIFFIHVIDDQGSIVLNNQIPLAPGDQSAQDELMRFNTISFPSPARADATRLAVGFYRGDQKLVADRGVRDWNGGRVIVPAP